IAAVEPDCNNKAITKFQTAYDKPGACSDPPSTVCELIADDCRDKVRIALPDGDGTNPSVCESKRLKAAGKKASRKLKCYAKAAAKDLPVDTACLGKATTKFTADFNKLTGCTGDGNTTGIEMLIDNECVNQLVTVDGMGHVTAIYPAVGATTTTTAGAGVVRKKRRTDRRDGDGGFSTAGPDFSPWTPVEPTPLNRPRNRGAVHLRR